jgi:hypothetical protein
MNSTLDHADPSYPHLRLPVCDQIEMCALSDRNTFPQCLGCRRGLAAIDPKLGENNGDYEG